MTKTIEPAITYNSFIAAVEFLGYGRFLPGTSINFTLPQLIRHMATDYFVGHSNVSIDNESDLDDIGNAWRIVKTVAREFEARGWFEFKKEE